MPSFLDGRTILVVDDEEAVREYVREILRPTGTNLKILEAGNGQEAVEILETTIPSIIRNVRVLYLPNPCRETRAAVPIDIRRPSSRR